MSETTEMNKSIEVFNTEVDKITNLIIDGIKRRQFKSVNDIREEIFYQCNNSLVLDFGYSGLVYISEYLNLELVKDKIITDEIVKDTLHMFLSVEVMEKFQRDCN